MTSSASVQTEVSSPVAQAVLAALSNPKFRWRTIGGVAAETSLRRNTVPDVIAREICKTVVVAPAPSTEGATPFATREPVRKTAFVAKKPIGTFENRLLYLWCSRCLPRCAPSRQLRGSHSLELWGSNC